MAGTLRMDYRPFTLRQLFVMFHAYMLHSWDQVTMHSTMLHIIDSRIVSMFAKKPARPKTFEDLHPIRKPKNRLVIKAKDIHLLKKLFS